MSEIAKMRAEALWVWWKVCFGALLLLGTVIFVKPQNEIGDNIMIFLRVAAASAVIAIPADLLMYFVVLKNCDSEYKRSLAIAKLIKDNGGMCGEALDMLREGYRHCLENKDNDKYRSYLSGYAIDLASVCENADEAYGYLEQVNTEELRENKKYTSFRMELQRYYIVLITADMNAGNREKAQEHYNEAAELFADITEEHALFWSRHVMDMQYRVFTGRFAEAIELADSISAPDCGIRTAVFVQKASALINLGRKAEAAAILDEAEKINRIEMYNVHIRMLRERCSEESAGS